MDIRPGSEALSNVRLGMVRFKHIFSRLRDCPGTELHPEVCREEGGQRGRWFWISTRSLYGGEHQIEKFVFEYNYGSGGGMHPYGSH